MLLGNDEYGTEIEGGWWCGDWWVAMSLRIREISGRNWGWENRKEPALRMEKRASAKALKLHWVGLSTEQKNGQDEQSMDGGGQASPRKAKDLCKLQKGVRVLIVPRSHWAVRQGHKWAISLKYGEPAFACLKIEALNQISLKGSSLRLFL